MTSTGRVFVTEQGETIHGILAEFASPPAVYHAAEKVRDAGYTRWDVHTPFPVHGMEDAMGFPRTNLPVLIAVMAFTGAGLAFLMQHWMAGVDYPMVHQGKPYSSWQAFVPITFELGVLFAAFTALIGMLARNGLPRWHHPLFKKERFLASSDDRFFICVEANDPKFDPEATRMLLEKAGATSIELVEE
jgi:hypothetical protein